MININGFQREQSSNRNHAGIVTADSKVDVIISEKYCPYSCVDGCTMYVDQEGYDCPTPCPNCK